MSVENVKPGINIGKLAEWLAERTTTTKCPFCDNHNWSAVNGAGHVGSALPYGDGKGDMYMAGYPLVALVCRNCNFVRNIALTPSLLEIVAEDPQSASE